MGLGKWWWTWSFDPSKPEMQGDERLRSMREYLSQFSYTSSYTEKKELLEEFGKHEEAFGLLPEEFQNLKTIHDTYQRMTGPINGPVRRLMVSDFYKELSNPHKRGDMLEALEKKQLKSPGYRKAEAATEMPGGYGNLLMDIQKSRADKGDLEGALREVSTSILEGLGQRYDLTIPERYADQNGELDLSKVENESPENLHRYAIGSIDMHDRYELRRFSGDWRPVKVAQGLYNGGIVGTIYRAFRSLFHPRELPGKLKGPSRSELLRLKKTGELLYREYNTGHVPGRQ